MWAERIKQSVPVWLPSSVFAFRIYIMSDIDSLKDVQWLFFDVFGTVVDCKSRFAFVRHGCD